MRGLLYGQDFGARGLSVGVLVTFRSPLLDKAPDTIRKRLASGVRDLQQGIKWWRN